MHPRVVVFVSLALAMVHGVATELYMRRGLNMPSGVTTAFTLTFCALAYLWYFQDAKLRGFNRRPALSAAVILLPFVGLPLYAASSRAQTGRISAAFKAFGFIVLLLLVSVSSGIALQVLGAA